MVTAMKVLFRIACCNRTEIVAETIAVDTTIIIVESIRLFSLITGRIGRLTNPAGFGNYLVANGRLLDAHRPPWGVKFKLGSWLNLSLDRA